MHTVALRTLIACSCTVHAHAAVCIKHVAILTTDTWPASGLPARRRRHKTGSKSRGALGLNPSLGPCIGQALPRRGAKAASTLHQAAVQSLVRIPARTHPHRLQRRAQPWLLRRLVCALCASLLTYVERPPSPVARARVAQVARGTAKAAVCVCFMPRLHW